MDPLPRHSRKADDIVSTNWSGNYAYRAARIAEPATLGELVEVVITAHAVKALGTRHSFNGIADTEGTQVSLTGLIVPPVIGENTVTVSSATRYGDLALALNRHGRALHNLASLPHISVGGAIATATHGSGLSLGNLSTAVRSLEILRADGELVVVDDVHPDFDGAVVALGALGIVTRVTLATEPGYDVAQTVFTDLDWETVIEQFEHIMGVGYSVSMFTDWGERGVQQVWVKSRRGIVPELLGHPAAEKQLHPVPDNPGDVATGQLGAPGLWNDRLPHFRLGFTPSHGEEIQTEYLLPLSSAPDAIAALRSVGQLLAPLLLISELRTVAADELWMSTAYRRDSLAIHFTWRRDQAGVEAVLPLIEDAIAPFDPRAHWGKVSRATSELPRLGEFRDLVERWDPRGVFRNDYLHALLGN